MKIHKGHILPVLAATVVAGAPVFHGVFAQQAGATQAQQSRALSSAEASRVAREMDMSLEDAVAQGYLAPGAESGTYLVTQPGAEAYMAATGVEGGASVIAGLSQVELTALIAGLIGVALVTVSDEDAEGPAGTTPTPLPPTLPPTPTPPPGTTTTTTTTTGTTATGTSSSQ